MSSIEERYGNPIEPHCFETDREEQWYQIGEVHGATEQREIDIKKACEWLMQHAYDYYYTSQQADCCGYDDENLIADFRKAMEAE